MVNIEQNIEEHGTTILKLARVKEVSGGVVRLFGIMMFSIKILKETDVDMMLVRIIPLSGNNKKLTNINQLNASDKLSLNKFSATVNHRSSSIDLGPHQGGYLEDYLRGRGIGSFAFNEIVTWLKGSFPDYTVTPFDFISPDNFNDEEKDRRAKFVENFGFAINYTDHHQKTGSIKVKKASNLKEYYNSEKIDELSIEQYVFSLISDKAKLEKDYNELKIDYNTKASEVIAGVPKTDIIKYTLIGIAVVVVLMALLLI